MKSTSDIWFASFLKMEGYEIKDVTVVTKNKGRFTFDISEEEWIKLKIKCDKSEVSKIKAMQTSLKDLLH